MMREDNIELPEFGNRTTPPAPTARGGRPAAKEISMKDTVRLPSRRTISGKDRDLSNHLVYLMSLLEQGRIRLEAARRQPAAALAVVASMIGRAIELAKRLDDQTPPTELLEQGEAFLQAAQRLESRLAGSPWQQLWQWLGGESDLSPKQHQHYQEVLTQASGFLGDFCRHCANCFTTSVAAVEWCDTYQPFLKELNDTIGQQAHSFREFP